MYNNKMRTEAPFVLQSLKGQLKCKTKTSEQTIYSHLNTKLYFLIIFALSLAKLLPSLWLIDTPGFRHFVLLLPLSKRGRRHNVNASNGRGNHCRKFLLQVFFRSYCTFD